MKQLKRRTHNRYTAPGMCLGLAWLFILALLIGADEVLAWLPPVS